MMVEVVNVVGSGDLGVEFDLKSLAEDVPNAIFDDNHRPAPPTFQLMHENSLILVYRTGSYAIRGGKSISEVVSARDKLADILNELDVIDGPEDLSFTIQNVVCIGDIGHSVDLNRLLIDLGLEKVEYEPEQFPGLIYRPENSNIVILVFSTGKVSIMNAKSKDDAQAEFKKLADLV